MRRVHLALASLRNSATLVDGPWRDAAVSSVKKREWADGILNHHQVKARPARQEHGPWLWRNEERNQSRFLRARLTEVSWKS